LPPANLDRPNPRLIRAEAALWVTRLHGPDRDSRLETSCRRWLKANPQHARAFELATDAWMLGAKIARDEPAYRLSARLNSPRRLVRSAVAAAALACGLAAATVFFLLDGALATGPGEQKTVTLSDGTEVTLNANTHILVQYDDHVRRVVLAAGEALFKVTKRQTRPFDVVIGDHKVVALGTSFQVRREDPTGSAFAVTLLEGQVAVESLTLPDVIPPLPLPDITLLHPGQRLRIENEVKKMDAPSIPKVTAWQHGQLIFEDASLSEAAAEFNRYGKDKIAIDGAEIGRIRVGGVYRIGDPASFAQVIAGAHHLRISRRGHEILMTETSLDAR
jgi:transmembrane sensor